MPQPRVLAVVLLWIPAVLVADTRATSHQQLLLGALTWLLLIYVAWSTSPLVRVQTVVVVCFATIVEYIFSGWLGVYEYRLDQVPAYVPPGHGLVYLAALSLGGLAWVNRNQRLCLYVTAAAVLGYAVYGLSPLAPRCDVLGAFWAACLVAFLLWGRSKTLYVGAFAVVTYLELIGTHLGVWTWGTHDPTGVIPIGNPPSGVAGGYGWFDLVAVLAAPGLLVAWSRLRRPALVGEGAQDGVVHETVRSHRVPAAERV